MVIAPVTGSPESVQADETQTLLDARVAENPGTGIIAGVIDHGAVRIYQAGISGTQRPLDQHTLFEIGSVTKTFTATVLAEMTLAGKVRPSDPVARYLPTSVHVPSRNGAQITLLNLATQHSGLPRLPDNFGRFSTQPENPYATYTVADLYAFLNDYQLTRDPGAKFEYSNLGVGLLGLALSRASNASYEATVRQYVWNPLGMNETRIALNADDRTRFAAGHDDTGARVHAWDFTDASAGAGAIRSDMHDMLLYLHAAMGDGPLAKAMLFAEQPRADVDAGTRIGLVWLNDQKRGLIWHNGGTGGYRAVVMMTADRTRGVVMLSNGPEPDDLAGHVLVANSRLEPPILTLPDADIAEYVGRYVNASNGITYLITRNGTIVIAQIVGQPASRIYPSRVDHFFYREVLATIEFVREDGHVVGLILSQSGRNIPVYKIGGDCKPLATELTPNYPPVITLDAQTLQAHVGTYDLVGTPLTITVEDGHTFAKLEGQGASEIFPSSNDAFFYKAVDAQITFQRDLSGKVTGLTLTQNGSSIPAPKKP